MAFQYYAVGKNEKDMEKYTNMKCPAGWKNQRRIVSKYQTFGCLIGISNLKSITQLLTLSSYPAHSTFLVISVNITFVFQILKSFNHTPNQSIN